MPVADVVERVLAGERGDCVREAVRLVAEELMGRRFRERSAPHAARFRPRDDRSRRLSPGHTTHTYLTRVKGCGGYGIKSLDTRLVAGLLAAPPGQRARGRAGVERAMAQGLRAAAAIPQWRNVVLRPALASRAPKPPLSIPAAPNHPFPRERGGSNATSPQLLTIRIRPNRVGTCVRIEHEIGG